MKACGVCAAPVSKRNKSGKCVSCSAKSKRPGTPRPTSRKCLDCGGPVAETSKTGRCRSCATIHYNKLPETSIARREGWKKRLAKPGEYERLCKVARRNSQKAMADPVKRAAAVERGTHVLVHYMRSPEALERWRASRPTANEKLREHRLGWCPLEYRELHRENVERHRMKAAQSREYIEKLVAEKEAGKYARDALEYLRKYAPVSVVEDGYRFGNAILTATEVVARARFRGWEPDRWAA